MAEDTRPHPEDEPIRPDATDGLGDVVEEIDPDLEPEAPRRAASAEFLVQAEAGSEASLRVAMDPANQSLREALRLSYRVLQVVIVALVIVFVFSGVTRVEPEQSGVMLRFGEIVGDPGDQALEPGARFSVLPYPAGEFVIFRDRNRPVDLSRVFWPDMAGREFDAAVDAAVANRVIPPGPNRQNLGDGYVLTAGGDIGHLKLEALYDVEEPVDFIRAVTNAPVTASGLSADAAVRLAMMRAAVHVSAGLELSEFVEFTDQERGDIRREAQSLLERPEVATGIRLREIGTPVAPVPAFAIVRAQRDLQEARRRQENAVEQARQLAGSTLIEVAGENYQELLELIEAYEDADPATGSEESAAVLARIDELLEDRGKSGQIALIIEQARARRSFIEATLGQQYLSYQELLESYRRNPRMVVDREWAQTFARLLTPADTEILQLPDGLRALSLSLTGSEEVQRRRRDQDLDRAGAEAARGTLGSLPFLQGASDMDAQLDRRPGRILERDASSRGSEAFDG